MNELDLWTEDDAAKGRIAAKHVGEPKAHFWTAEEWVRGLCDPKQLGTYKHGVVPRPPAGPSLTEQLTAIEAAIKDGKLPSAREEYQKAFHLIGGTEALAKWAQANPEKFYALHSKLMPQTVEGEVNHKVAVLQLSWLVTRNTEGELVPPIEVVPSAQSPAVTKGQA